MSLDRRHTKVTDLGNDGHDDTVSKQNKKVGSCGLLHKMIDQNAIQNEGATAKQRTADASLHRLLGADLRDQLVLPVVPCLKTVASKIVPICIVVYGRRTVVSLNHGQIGG